MRRSKQARTPIREKSNRIITGNDSFHVSSAPSLLKYDISRFKLLRCLRVQATSALLCAYLVRGKGPSLRLPSNSFRFSTSQPSPLNPSVSQAPIKQAIDN